MSMLPFMISSMVEADVSRRRITNFLLLEESKSDNVIFMPAPTSSSPSQAGTPAARLILWTNTPRLHYLTVPGFIFSIHGGVFGWNDADKPTLNNIDVDFNHGQLTAIVGSVGCGKSSLISALLGEMDKRAGRVVMPDRVAYVPQQAWIRNGY